MLLLLHLLLLPLLLAFFVIQHLFVPKKRLLDLCSRFHEQQVLLASREQLQCSFISYLNQLALVENPIRSAKLTSLEGSYYY